VNGLYSAVVVSVIVDLGFQVGILAFLRSKIIDPGLSTPLQIYMMFLNWRFSKRMVKYEGVAVLGGA
jgi:hypothetical protein